MRKSFGILAAAMLAGSVGSNEMENIKLTNSPKKIYKSLGGSRPLNQRQKRRNKRRVCKY